MFSQYIIKVYLESDYTAVFVVQGGKHIMGIGADIG